MSLKMRSYGSQYRVYQKVIFGNTTNILCCIYVQHFLQPTPWILPYSTMHRLLQMGYQEIPLGELLWIWMMILLVKDNSGNINFLQSQYFHLVFCTIFIFKFIYKLDVTLSHILDTIKSLQDINQGTNKCQKESFKIKSTSCLCEAGETFFSNDALFMWFYIVENKYYL